VFDDDFPTSNDQTGVNGNGTVRDADAAPKNGSDMDNGTENLLTPFHFLDVKSKRDAFKKQCLSDMEDSEC
jgi:hypothetical protein